MLKGALLPSDAGAWLLGAEEARGHWLQEGFEVLYTERAPWFLPVSEDGRVCRLWLGGGLPEDRLRDGVFRSFFRTKAGPVHR